MATDGEWEEFSHFISNLDKDGDGVKEILNAFEAGKNDVILNFLPAASTTAQISAVELLVDSPTRVGCFQFEATMLTLPAGSATPSPAACASNCLTLNPANRYAALQVPSLIASISIIHLCIPV